MPALSVEQNAAMIEPGLEQATEAFKKAIYDEVKQTLDAIYATHGKGQWKKKLMINDRIADSVFQQVLMRADEYSVLATSESQRRLSFGCLRGTGWWAGDGPGIEHRRRLWRVRGYAWHRAEICGQGCDQSEFRDAIGRDDV